MRKTTLLLLLFLIATVLPSRAQYFGTRSMEQSFEATDFFFRPSALNPFGLKGFGRVAPGLIDDPLLNAQLNPALLAQDSLLSAYGYVDFRRERDDEEIGVGYCPYCFAVPGTLYDDRIAVPYYLPQNRREIEPIFSAAAFGRPRALPRLIVGGTYQLSFRDEAYYAIPFDAFRIPILAQAGDNSTVRETPIVDRNTGIDQFRSVGHHGVVYAAMPVSRRVDVGLRIGASWFDRDGTLENRSNWQNDYTVPSASIWASGESRTQDYQHTEFAIGTSVKVTRRTNVGVIAGYLDGSAVQNLVRFDTTSSTYGLNDIDENFSLYRGGSEAQQRWDHDGRQRWTGAYLSTHMSPAATLRIDYRSSRADVDIDLASSARDSSRSDFSNVYEAQFWASQSSSSGREIRSGGGATTDNSDRIAATIRWTPDSRTHVHAGLSLEFIRSETTTTEAIDARQHSQYAYENRDDAGSNEFGLREIKDLTWTFDARTTEVDVPVYLTHKLSSTFTLHFGINRRMRFWKLRDETLVVYELQEQISDENVSIRTDFGERFASPAERESEVRTTVITGLTLSTSDRFSIRMLAAPELRNRFGTEDLSVRWWISFNLRINQQ